MLPTFIIFSSSPWQIVVVISCEHTLLHTASMWDFEGVFIAEEMYLGRKNLTIHRCFPCHNCGFNILSLKSNFTFDESMKSYRHKVKTAFFKQVKLADYCRSDEKKRWSRSKYQLYVSPWNALTTLMTVILGNKNQLQVC